MFYNRMTAFPSSDTMNDFSEMLGRLFVPQRPRGPAFNVWLDENGAVLTSEMPGLAMNDLEITVSGRNVTVKGQRPAEAVEGENSTARRERAAGAFERKLQVGMEIDTANVRARLVNGVLEIHLPRAESDKPRKIAISAE